jgi:methylthioribose-1-phosphate isomerase
LQCRVAGHGRLGTVLAPIYRAYDDGIPMHVWVDETRPRNQAASLTAWELGQHGIAHTVVVDNAGGHLMREGLDLCIVGTDRTTAGGDVANKIGTYLKALAARDNDIPFYVALPSPTIDWEIESGQRFRSNAATIARSPTSKAGPRREGASPFA